MGRLSAEDWRPLLAASILYNYVLLRDKNRTSLIRLVLPVGIGEIPLIFALLVVLRLPDRNLSIELLWATVALWAIYTLSLLRFYTGYNSLGLLFFHWSASLGTSFSDATYTPPIVMTTLGGSPGGSPSQLTAFGVSLFILLPIALLIATLLSPEEWRILSAGFSYLQRLRHHSETNPEDQR